jgi:hypothetical protein
MTLRDLGLLTSPPVSCTDFLKPDGTKRKRDGEWKCGACGHWLKNSLEIWVHIRAGPQEWAEHIRRGGALCVRERIYYECREHGAEAA